MLNWFSLYLNDSIQTFFFYELSGFVLNDLEIAALVSNSSKHQRQLTK